MADVRFVCSVDTSTGTAAIEKLEGAIQGLGKETQGAGEAAAESGSKFSGLASQLVSTGVVVTAAYSAYRILKQTLFDSIAGAADYEKAVKGLSAAFDISGRTMPGMVQHLQDYAERLQALGLADDGAILKAESLTMQLTQLDEKGIKAVTRGAIGLADVFGMDMQTAVEMLSRGMEGQYMALNRLFPAIRNATGEGEKHAALMKIMEGMYARAIADTGTYSGQVKKLGIEFSEMKKHLGEAIIGSGILQGAMEGLAVAIAKVEGLLGKQTQAEVDHNRAEIEALDILQKVAETTNRSNSWIQQQTSLYHENYEALLEDVRAGALGTKEQKAAEAAVRAHNAAVDAQGASFTETGKVVLSFDEKLRAMYIAAHAHAMALIDDSVHLRIELQKTALPEAGLKFFLGDQAVEQEKKLRAVASLIVADIRGINNIIKDQEKELRIWSEAIGQIGDIFNLMSQSATIALDNEYKKRAATINATIKDETKKQAAIDALDKEFEAKRHKAAVAAAIEGKAMAIAQAIINVAEGVTKCFAMLGPFGIPMATIIEALGAIQIALIAAQPIPAAKGFEGIVTRPTLFLAGEAGPERVSVRNQAQGLGGGGGVTVNINSPLVVTSGLADSDLERAGSKLYQVIKDQARRFGRTM